MALNLLAQILLASDYGNSAVDNSQWSDMSAWVADGGFITSQNSTNLVINNTSGSIRIKRIVPIDLTSASGSRFRISFSASVTTAGSYEILAFIGSASGTIQISNSDPWITLVAGVQTIDLDFDTAARTWDSIRLVVQSKVASNPLITIDFSSMVLTGLDASTNDLFDDGDRIYTYWDDVANNYVVKREDNPAATLTTITSGPDLVPTSIGARGAKWYVENPYTVIDGAFLNSSAYYAKIIQMGYSFCSGTELRQFRINGQAAVGFPYVYQFNTENHPSCSSAAPVCDLFFLQSYVDLKPTNAYTTGSVYVRAFSSYGEVRFSTDDVLFNAMPPSIPSSIQGYQRNITLGVGTWTIYARDQYNCLRTAVVTVTAFSGYDLYNVLLRQEHRDIQNNVLHRIDILERGYNGSLTEVIADSNPFLLSKPNGDLNNKFGVLHPTYGTLNLVSQTNFQFIGLFSQDDTKFMVKYYVNNVEIWRGFIVPSTYSEQYVHHPYVASLQATDRLALMENTEYLDDSGNKLAGRARLIDILWTCFKKANPTILTIWSGINKFATGMSIGGDNDPLDKTYIRQESFYETDGTPWTCKRVMEAILKPFGAEVIQQEGRWNIVEVDAKTASYYYRIYTITNNVPTITGNGVYNPILEIKSPSLKMGLAFKDSNANLEILPAYGKISTRFKLRPVVSVFSPSLDRGWTLYLIDANGAFAFPVSIPDSQLKGMYFGSLDFGGTSRQIAMGSVPFIINSQSDAFIFSFKYKIALDNGFAPFPAYGDLGGPIVSLRFDEPLWVRISWQLSISVSSTVLYYNTQSGWTTDTFFEWNHIFVTDFKDSFKDFNSETINLPVFSSTTSIAIQSKVLVNGTYAADFTTSALLKAIDSVKLPIGHRVKGSISSTFRWYKLRAGTDAESAPTIYRPDDYNASTNAVVWELETQSPFPAGVREVIVKDAVGTFLPARTKAPEEELIPVVINSNIKENTEVELEAGDLPETISAYQLYYNIFTTSAGLPTSGWKRAGITESLTIQKLLMKHLVNQYSKPSWKLSGSFVGFTNFNFLHVVKHTISAIAVSLTNTAFNTLSGWSNFGSGTSWVANGGNTKASVSLSSADSKVLIQSATIDVKAGARMQVTLAVERSLSTTTTRADTFMIVLYKAGVVVQELPLLDFTSNVNYTSLVYRFNLLNDIDNIGFYIKNVTGPTESATYEVDSFVLSALTVVRYYQPDRLDKMDRHNDYATDLVQLIPAFASTDPTLDDTGGGNTGGNGGGGTGSFSGDFNNDFGGDFDTVLN